jgi:hypothetical protein
LAAPEDQQLPAIKHVPPAIKWPHVPALHVSTVHASWSLQSIGVNDVMFAPGWHVWHASAGFGAPLG